MKIRYGFISNSSSSSFVCNKYESEYNNFKASELFKVKDKLIKIFECMKILEIITPETKFSDIFKDPRKASKENIEDLNEGWNANLQYNEQMFLINSTSDNTIPYQFFEIIADIFNAERIHLG